jgi:uncharacterized membrane protein YfhO
MVEPSPKLLAEKLATTDLHRVALVERSLPIPLEPARQNVTEQLRFVSYEANRMTIDVESGSRALLVLSELFDTGWRASINDNAGEILKVDGGLRGLLIPAGRSRIVLRYAPTFLLVGSVVSSAWWAGSLAVALIAWRQNRGSISP